MIGSSSSSSNSGPSAVGMETMPTAVAAVGTTTASGNIGSISVAQIAHMFQTMSPSTFKLLLLIMMVLQNSSTVLVGRYTRAGVPKAEQYNVNHLIVVIECGKLLLSLALEYHTTHGKLIQSLETHITQRPMDALLIAIPALLYLVQNTLLYVALTNLSAPIFQVTYQAKLVTTAVVSVIMLARTYSVQQWICLVLLSLGVAIVVLGENGDKPSSSTDNITNEQSLTLGLTAVTIACFSSALAGVYFEKVLKTPTENDATKVAPASLWMRNIQLSIFSIIIALAQGMFAKTGANSATQSYFHGFTSWAWVLVILQAGGGLLVAAVIKYADNVLKGLATGVSVVLATVASTILFGTAMSAQFTMGATLILGAVYYFSNPIPGFAVAAVAAASSRSSSTNGEDSTASKTEEKVELKSLLPK